MVVSWERLDGIVPLEPASMEDRTIIQWDKDDCEAQDRKGRSARPGNDGCAARFDHADPRASRRRLELYKIPHDDPEVYEALQNADTVGMFQVESRAQIAFLPKSKPAKFYDIVVQVAIIRPGPIVGKMLHSYIKRRQGLEEIDYIHTSL